ncbi:hypothetical protein [Caldivirga maquilingensis]|uniref:PIN domain-containing protein n=1 Tax=Caldivirga maquilingensis (strain ATCC 700844 / DSM 13496 / JCM 10307 / IC-167) TaxID=397948 RepID=A8M948_CALMQ|nr:hypothetical protein [Caldivirga maquilingensis]ABW02267.1 conserved hypothetical protein [Caldivirga maquilingensis IC-167]
MTLHVILDHSALIPCGDKPKEEKEAIREIMNRIMDIDVTWHVTGYYLKVLNTVLNKNLKNHHPLPRLLASLERTKRYLLELSRSKQIICKPRRLKSLKIHVIARKASERVEIPHSERLNEINNEDVEIIAIGLTIAERIKGEKPVYIVTTDTKLEEAIDELEKLGIKELKAITPSKLLEELPKQ